jgi:hypothetical protein
MPMQLARVAMQRAGSAAEIAGIVRKSPAS